MIPMHYLIPEDVELIKSLLDMVPKDGFPKMAIDLGVGVGGTALTVLSHREDFFVFSVDIDTVAMKRAMTLIDGLGFLGRWHGDICRSDKAQRPLLDYDICLLMCDATHDYASQQDELNHWIPRLAIGTPVWIHEYAGYANVSYPGVKIAVDEFVAQGLLRPLKISGLSWSGLSG
jgi:hypothetical protein